MKDIKIKEFDSWLNNYNSKYEMLRDLENPNSIMIIVNENDYYQIGVENNLFYLAVFRKEEFFIIEETSDRGRLVSWQLFIEMQL